MSGKSMSIGEATGAKIHYHTGVFNGKNKTAMTMAGLVGITALAIGILAVLHANGIVNAGPFGSIPPGGAYALIAVGGGLVVADVIALVIYSVRHARIKKPMQELMKMHSQSKMINWYTDRFAERTGEVRPRKSVPDRFARFSNEGDIEDTKIYGTLKVSGLDKSIHLFLDQKLHNSFMDGLAARKFRYVEWNQPTSY